MRLKLLVTSVALGAVLAAPAMATEKDNNDIRCVVAFLNQAGADSSKADGASYVAAYFYGKLLTRNAGKAPASLVTDQSIPPNQAALQADLSRCAREFAEAKQKIDAINAELMGRIRKSGGAGASGSADAPARPASPPLPDITAPAPWQGQADPSTRP